MVKITFLQLSGKESITHTPGHALFSGVVGQHKAEFMIFISSFCSCFLRERKKHQVWWVGEVKDLGRVGGCENI